MRIEAGDREARLRDAETRRKIARGDPAGVDNQRRRELCRERP